MGNTASKVLPFLGARAGGSHGAAIIGAHLEGPFIAPAKKVSHKHTLPNIGLDLQQNMADRELFSNLRSTCFNVTTVMQVLPCS